MDDICNGNISKSTLSRIEKYNQVPNFDTMQYLLQQIDISFDEFDYLCHDYSTTERQEIIDEFYGLVSNSNLALIEKLIQRCEDYLKKDENLKIQEILLILNGRQSFFHDKLGVISDYTKELVSPLWKRLENASSWSYEDVRLMNCILYHLPIEVVEKNIPKIQATLRKYEGFKNMSTLNISLLLNLSTLFLYNSKINKCQEILDEAFYLNIKLKRYDFLGVILVRKGICAKNIDEINNGLKLLELVGELSRV